MNPFFNNYNLDNNNYINNYFNNYNLINNIVINNDKSNLTNNSCNNFPIPLGATSPINQFDFNNNSNNLLYMKENEVAQKLNINNRDIKEYDNIFLNNLKNNFINGQIKYEKAKNYLNNFYLININNNIINNNALHYYPDYNH